jgi:nucleoside recognition membrane protein YjiH
VAGLEKVKPEYLELAWEKPDGTVVLMLLLPAVVSFIPRQQGKVLHLSFAAVGILYIILSIWTVGSLSAQIADQEQWPMYEAVKSISLFGIAERFEAVVSAAVTMSWFSLYSLLLSAAGSLSARISPAWASKGTISAAVIAAVWILLRPQIPMVLPVFFTLSLWCIGPIPGLFNKLQKSAKKPKNNP